MCLAPVLASFQLIRVIFILPMTNMKLEHCGVAKEKNGIGHGMTPKLSN